MKKRKYFMQKFLKKRNLAAVCLIAVFVLCGCGKDAVWKTSEGQKKQNSTGKDIQNNAQNDTQNDTQNGIQNGDRGGIQNNAEGGTRNDIRKKNAGQGTGTAQKTENAGKTPGAQEADPYVQPEMKGEITISCLFTDEFLDTAAEAFMKLYPDVKVTVNGFEDASDSGSVEDYLTYLNTKIMTGKAEDILLTSFLPVTKYSETGVFEDLSGYVQKTPELNEENYYMNVLKAAEEKDGQLFIIPYMARFDALALSPELMRAGEKEIDMHGLSFGEVMELAGQMVEETDKSNAFLIRMDEVSYADCLIKDSIGQFIDTEHKKVNLDTPEYQALLESVKSLSENGCLNPDINFYNMEYYFAANCDYDVQAAYYSMDAGSGKIPCMPITDAQGRTLMKSNYCMALNHASAHKDLAWEFMRYLLSDEVQALPSLHGPAVSRRGLKAAARRNYAFYQEGNGGFGSEAEYKKILEDWMSQINGCDMLDSAIMTLIEEENEQYFSGRQTAGETAKKLQRKLEQYFYE